MLSYTKVFALLQGLFELKKLPCSPAQVERIYTRRAVRDAVAATLSAVRCPRRLSPLVLVGVRLVGLLLRRVFRGVFPRSVLERRRRSDRGPAERGGLEFRIVGVVAFAQLMVGDRPVDTGATNHLARTRGRRANIRYARRQYRGHLFGAARITAIRIGHAD